MQRSTWWGRARARSRSRLRKVISRPASQPTGMTAAIEVHGLAKSYGDVRAVNGIDFSVREGEVFAFLGPNGAGKTTTVEILEGLRKRTSGEVRVLGLDPWTDANELHRMTGVIPQDFRFFDEIHPKEAIGVLCGVLFGTKPDANGLLARVGLLEKADARYDTLSGGQKQKLGLALALANDPKVCFLRRANDRSATRRLDGRSGR